MSNTNFPGSLDTFTNPGSSDSESAGPVPHHLQHGKVNDAIAALEAKIGIDGSAVGTSLDYLIKQSNNPGHHHTLPISTQNLTISGTTAQSGAGLWSNAGVIYMTTAGPSGGIILRPQGPTAPYYQFLVTAAGHVATSDVIGAVRNTLDDGSGNVVVAGNMNITGNLVVTGGATIPFSYSSGETTTLSFDPTSTTSDGSDTDLARADHRHGLPPLSTALPIAASSAPSAGYSLLPARGDHIHPLEEAPGFIQMWPTSAIPAGYLLCDGTNYPISSYSPLATALNATSPSSPAYIDGTNFKVPDFQGVSPIGAGTSGAYASSAPSTRVLGTYYGSEKITIAVNQMPAHNHDITDIGHKHLNHLDGLTGDQNIYTIGGTGVTIFTQSTQGTGYLNVSWNASQNITNATTGITIKNSTAPTNQTPVLHPTYAVNFVIKT